MHKIGAVTFMHKTPAMTIVALDILATIYYFDAIVINFDPNAKTNNTNNNKNKY
jgi:hypothetical protein